MFGMPPEILIKEILQSLLGPLFGDSKSGPDSISIKKVRTAQILAFRKVNENEEREDQRIDSVVADEEARYSKCDCVDPHCSSEGTGGEDDRGFGLCQQCGEPPENLEIS